MWFPGFSSHYRGINQPAAIETTVWIPCGHDAAASRQQLPIEYNMDSQLAHDRLFPLQFVAEMIRDPIERLICRCRSLYRLRQLPLSA
jgi:hypothetical protein